MTLRAYFNGQLAFTGSMHDKHICLDEATTTFTTTSQQAYVGEASDNKHESKFDLWHRRCGHISRKAIIDMPEAVDGVELPKSPPFSPAGETACEPCLTG